MPTATTTRCSCWREPHGPTCHLGTASCFGDGSTAAARFLAELEALVAQRERDRPEGSYTTKLFDEGVRRIAQKVGEEGVETALAAVAQDDDALVGEALISSSICSCCCAHAASAWRN